MRLPCSHLHAHKPGSPNERLPKGPLLIAVPPLPWVSGSGFGFEFELRFQFGFEFGLELWLR